MDARILLRRYLEQRRELGESELVLDTLKVEDVMRLLGAAGKSAASVSAPQILRDLAAEVLGDDVQDLRSREAWESYAAEQAWDKRPCQ